MQKNVIEYLQQTVTRFPEKTAVKDSEMSITFGELLQNAQKISAALVNANIGLNNPIGVYIPKGCKMIESFAGINMSGNFYVPLDTKSPASRVNSIITTLESKVLITDRAHLEALKAFANAEILVVEDNKSVADYIAGLFAGSFGVSVASNGEDGFSMALDIVPDLIITDLMMPGTDGFEFCRNVRNNEVIDHIPIIIVTAKIQQKERMRGFEAGADAFLTKPFDSDELRILVDNQLERHRNLRMKFSCNGLSSAPVGEEQMSEQENRFLAKASDIVLSLMESRRLDVPTIAQKLCMSPRQLHRKIVTLTGAPPSSFILNVRMQRACALMRAYPGWTVEEIADKCGFDHVTSFYHSFKKVYGLTPSEYRRKML